MWNIQNKMTNQFSRTELLIGEKGIEKLKNSKVIVFGIGGVGGYVVEALARAGIGAIDIVDNDKVTISNLNRQIIATHSSIGQYKVDVAQKRLLDINPDIKIEKFQIFYTPENKDNIDFGGYDYVVDAIDTVVGKISIIEEAKKRNIPVISSMGAGNKLNSTSFCVADISKTSVCPLARVIRLELKKRNIKDVKVVYSTESPIKPALSNEKSKKNSIPGSISYVPSIAGLIIAGEVIKDLILKI